MNTANTIEGGFGKSVYAFLLRHKWSCLFLVAMIYRNWYFAPKISGNTVHLNSLPYYFWVDVVYSTVAFLIYWCIPPLVSKIVTPILAKAVDRGPYEQIRAVKQSMWVGIATGWILICGLGSLSGLHLLSFLQQSISGISLSRIIFSLFFFCLAATVPVVVTMEFFSSIFLQLVAKSKK